MLGPQEISLPKESLQNKSRIVVQVCTTMDMAFVYMDGPIHKVDDREHGQGEEFMMGCIFSLNRPYW